MLCPHPEWDAEGHIDESNLKYLQGRTGVLSSPFPEHPLGLGQFVAVELRVFQGDLGDIGPFPSLGVVNKNHGYWGACRTLSSPRHCSQAPADQDRVS